MTTRTRVLSFLTAFGLVLAGFLPPMTAVAWRWELSPNYAMWMEQPIGMHPVEGIFTLAAFMLWTFLPLGPAYHYLTRACEGLELPKCRVMLVHSLYTYACFTVSISAATLGLYGLQRLNW